MSWVPPEDISNPTVWAVTIRRVGSNEGDLPVFHTIVHSSSPLHALQVASWQPWQPIEGDLILEVKQLKPMTIDAKVAALQKKHQLYSPQAIALVRYALENGLVDYDPDKDTVKLTATGIDHVGKLFGNGINLGGGDG